MNSYGLSFYTTRFRLIIIYFFGYECHPRYYQLITL